MCPTRWTVQQWHASTLTCSLPLSPFQPQFLFALAQVLGNNAASPVARSAAGLYLKNCLHSKDDTTNLQLQQRWLQIDPQARLEIKKVVCA